MFEFCAIAITVVFLIWRSIYSDYQQAVSILRVNPMVQPIKDLSEKSKETSRIITYNDRYIQHQLRKNGEWVLHNINGPAVYDSLSGETSFFINGIKYDNELQYLVAKECYTDE